MDKQIEDKIVDNADDIVNKISVGITTDTSDKEVLDNRTKMAWIALAAIILPTFYIVLRISNPELVDKLGSLLSWYYMALASIIGAYFGFRTWASIQGK